MRFSDIVEQDIPINILKKAFSNDRCAQAYLFVGPEGIGKRCTALVFAQLLNCKQLPMNLDEEEIDVCDECDACRKIRESNHPDVELITPEEGKKGISIKQIQELQKRIALKSMEGRKKVYIIDNANDMSRDAANCLLKTIEEPNEDVVIILIARNLYGLLPTVRSRCQALKFKTMTEDRIREILVKEHEVSDENASFIAELSQGRLGAAKKYAGEGMEGVLEFAGQILKAVRQKKERGYPDYESLFGFTDKIYRDKEGVSELLNCLLLSLRRRFIKEPTEKLKTGIETVLNTRDLIARSINTRTALNSMLIKLSGLH